jgi:hypothetical protein
VITGDSVIPRTGPHTIMPAIMYYFKTHELLTKHLKIAIHDANIITRHVQSQFKSQYTFNKDYKDF